VRYARRSELAALRRPSTVGARQQRACTSIQRFFSSASLPYGNRESATPEWSFRNSKGYGFWSDPTYGEVRLALSCHRPDARVARSSRAPFSDQSQNPLRTNLQSARLKALLGPAARRKGFPPERPGFSTN